MSPTQCSIACDRGNPGEFEWRSWVCISSPQARSCSLWSKVCCWFSYLSRLAVVCQIRLRRRLLTFRAFSMHYSWRCSSFSAVWRIQRLWRSATERLSGLTGSWSRCLICGRISYFSWFGTLWDTFDRRRWSPDSALWAHWHLCKLSSSRLACCANYGTRWILFWT